MKSGESARQMISVSIVLYKTAEAALRNAISSVLESKAVSKLYLVDNCYAGSNPCPGLDRVEYINPGRNLGYGAAHNLIMLDKSRRGGYHLAMNPDISFSPGTLEGLMSFMDANPDVGLAMPKVLNTDGSVQRLCKLLPSPFDLFIRRFLPGGLFRRGRERFELRHFDYAHTMDIPFLSGCFMFMRSGALDRIGGFDERIFLYGEDLDLSRRFRLNSRAVFFPGVQIRHEHQKMSFKSLRMLLLHCHGVACYFNKWGWFIDPDRRRINRETLMAVERHSSGELS